MESGRLLDCVRFCVDRKIEWLHISPYHGYYLKDVDFLSACGHVKGIHMQVGFDNYEGLYGLPCLTNLSVIFPNLIEFPRLRHLSDLATDWGEEIDDFLFAAKSIRRLWLRGYKPRSRGLERMYLLPQVERLHIVGSPIYSISGLQSVVELKALGLSYCSKLQEIHALGCLTSSLEELQLDHCKAITDFLVVKELKS